MSNDPLKIGKIIYGRYKVIKSIKPGGFGETYVVFDQNLGINKALKRLKLYQGNSPQITWFRRMIEQIDQAVWENAKKKFDREASILNVLGQHPQIPSITDRFNEKDEFYIVQDLIEGHDLSQELGQQKQSEEYAVKLIWEVLQILDFVHQYAIHRDISPNNIMRRQDSRLVLVDFGNVKQIRVNSSNPEGWVSAASSYTVWTDGYKAPEIDAGHPQRNSDIYALGMVAIYALTKIAPNQLQKDPRTLEINWLNNVVGINPNLAAIINKMVRYDCRQDRYQTAQSVISDLKQHFFQYAPATNLGFTLTPVNVSYSEELAPTKAIPGILPLSQLRQEIKDKPKLWEFLLFFFGSALVTASVSLVLNTAYTLGTGQVFAIYISVFVVLLFIRYKFFPKRERTHQRLDFEPRINLHSYNFPVMTLSGTGKKIDEQPGRAEYFREDLGNGVTLDMVNISGGEFQMGVTDQEVEEAVKNAVSYGTKEADARTWATWGTPRHRVQVPDFSMGKFLVTQEQWQQVAKMKKVKIDLKPEPANFKGEKLLPVDSVNWHQAVEFCARLSKHTGNAYKLPSEAQWEYACRSHTQTPFHFGATITPEYVNYDGNYPYAQAAKGEYRSKTTPVGRFPPNGFGLYDMHGNLWEWCEDDWHDSYDRSPKDGKAWIDNDNHSQGKTLVKMLRGGSWYDSARLCRSGYRYRSLAEIVHVDFGFRVACLPFLPRTH